ncbi:GATA transcription factor 1-like [Zingiber officinale]|uniref:GATA transcription factor 1-like n=1 Tax=Zingiber officinale TaxID=94328 RepID=UPI001C4B3641|nr:GATA transcription factor 1-like [Zingiber officinale]
MVDALKEAAPAPAGKAFFDDELVLLDFNAAAAAGELQPQALLFQDFFDASVDGLPGLPMESGGGGGDEEEEELEWLANKDAFPSLETSFEIPAHSLSGSSGGCSGGGAADAAREGPSPVSVLASAASFSAPARPRSKGRTQRRRLLTAIPPQPDTATATKARTAERRRCRHCLAEQTPQWRIGPEGPKTLCNACGVRYKSDRLVPEYRPARSPTFSAAIHSNSHRQILEMRRQKEAPHERKNTRPLPPLQLLTPPVKLISKKIKK